MRFRDRLRVTQKIKKGTSRNRRRKIAIIERMVEGLLDGSGIKQAADEAVMDALIWGRGAIETRWDDGMIRATSVSPGEPHATPIVDQ